MNHENYANDWKGRNIMKVAYAGFREKAFALVLWREGRLGSGLPFYRLMEMAQYDSSRDVVSFGKDAFKVERVEVSEKELAEAEH